MGVVIRVDFSGPQPGDVVADPSRLLTGPEVAALLGISPSTWRTLVQKGYAPPADEPGTGPVNRRRPKWRLSTIRTFKQTGRKGQGFRSDLVK